MGRQLLPEAWSEAPGPSLAPFSPVSALAAVLAYESSVADLSGQQYLVDIENPSGALLII